MGTTSSLRMCSLDYRCFTWLGTKFPVPKLTSIVPNLLIPRLQGSHPGEGTELPNFNSKDRFLELAALVSPRELSDTQMLAFQGLLYALNNNWEPIYPDPGGRQKDCRRMARCPFYWI